jgi:hypothetical protein
MRRSTEEGGEERGGELQVLLVIEEKRLDRARRGKQEDSMRWDESARKQISRLRVRG